MAKMIHVDEDHNGNAIRNVAAAVDPNDVVVLQQLEDALNGAGPLRDLQVLTAGPGIGIAGDVVSVKVGNGLTTAGGADGESLEIFVEPGGGIVAGPAGAAVDWSVVPVPAGPGDAVNKGYVDSLAAGMVPLESVRVATVANLPGLQASSVDGVILRQGDRVLVKNQDDPKENGVYEVDPIGRLVRVDGVGGLQVGSTVFVEEGATNGNSSFSVNSVGLPSDVPWVPGVDPNTWVKSSHIATGYTEGPGIEISGWEVSVRTGAGATLKNGVVEADVSLAGGLTKRGGEHQDSLALLPAAGGGIQTDVSGVSVKVDPRGGLVSGPDGLRIEGMEFPDRDHGMARVYRQKCHLSGGDDPEILPVHHNLGSRRVTVEVFVDGCSATVGVCCLNENTVLLEFGKVAAKFDFEVVVTG
jgi:hypothetical protein